MTSSTHPMSTTAPHIKRQCTAQSKRTGERCQRPAMTGNTVCYHHGGKSLKGVASPTYRHGRYSKHMPERLVDRLNQALEDPDYLNLHEEIALLEVQIGEALDTIHAGNGGSVDAVRKGWDAILRANQRGDKKAIPGLMNQLGAAIDRLTGEADAHDRLLDLINQKRLASETERKRQVQMKQLVTAEQAMTFVAALNRAVKEHVKDPAVLRAIQMDMAAVSNAGGR